MYWALAGILVPLIILFIDQLQGGVSMWPELTITLWPASILLLATDCAGLTLFAMATVTIAIIANVVVYSVVGVLAWWIYWQFMAKG